MPLPLTDRSKFLLLAALGLPETAQNVIDLLNVAGTGDVSGPGVSTDNAIVRFDGGTGALLQNSSVLIDDSGNISNVTTLSSKGMIAVAFATGADVTALNLSAGALSGTLRQVYRDFSGPKSYEFDSDFTRDILFIQSDTTTLGGFHRAGPWEIGGSGVQAQHILNTAVAASATAGSNGTLPAQVVGYVNIVINGTAAKIPYYAA